MSKFFLGHKSAAVILAMMTTFSFISCVNEEYDLSNGIDMDMTILKNVTVPLGNVKPIPISTLLGDLSAESSVLDIDDAGNMSLSFGNDKITNTFTMPEVEIGGDGGLKFDDNVEVKFIPKYKGINLGGLTLTQIPSTVPQEIHFSQSEGGILRRSFGMDLHKELPEQILEIDQVHLESTLIYRFKVSEGTVLHISKGFSMKFPDFMIIEKVENADNYEINPEEPQTVVFTKDTRLAENEPFTLQIAFNRMDFPKDAMEIVKNPDTGKDVRYISIQNATVDVEGDLYLALSDYNQSRVPECAVMTMDIELANLSMKSAHVKLNLDIAVDDENISIGELPDIFKGEGTVVDLYNPILRFKFYNGSPFNMYLNANITSYSKNHQTDIHIGDCTPYYDGEEHEAHATEPVVIYANSDVEYYFSRRGKHDGNTGTDIMLENIGDIIKEIPENITIHDILVETDDNFVNVKANEECLVELEYEFISPLAFGKDLNISFDYDIDLGLGGDTDGGSILDSLVISMDLLNTIPLDFAITSVALDSDGKEIKDASVNLNLNLAAGTLEEPAESPAEIVLRQNGFSSVDKLRLHMNARSSQKMEGRLLNTEQGLGINNLTVSLPKGITLDLASDNE